MSNQLIGAIFIGMTIGRVIPGFPVPVDVINPYLWIVFLVLGIIFLVKG